MTSAKLPPGPPRRPLFGDMFRYLRDPLGYMLRVRREHGDLVRLPLLALNPYLVSDPDLIERVLIADARSYTKDIFVQRLGREIIGQGLLSSEGDFWRRQRRLMQPAFHRERITSYATLMVEATLHMLQSFQPGQVRDLHADMMRLTLQIVTRALFSADVGDHAGGVGAALEVIMDRYARAVFVVVPMVARLPLPMNLRFHKTMAHLDDLVRRVIVARRAQGTASPGEDLLGMLLAAQDEDGSHMTDTQLRDEVLTLLAAGHETTALVLTYAFVLLSQHPQAAARLSVELEALGGRPPGAADLPALRYAECVVHETMRLYPPAWGLGREAACDTELGGYTIKKGTQVWMSQWVMHRDERHFPDPEAFRPERWEDGLLRRLPRFAYFPFGGGPRQCIGNAFALMEATLLLSTIAQRYRLAVQFDGPLQFKPSITLRPRGSVRALVQA